MKIKDLTLTLFKWEGIPKQLPKRHTGLVGSASQLGLLTITTDQGLQGHSFLGTSGHSAEMDAGSLIRYLKPVVMDQNPLDRERLHEVMSDLYRNTSMRAIGAVDVALWDVAGKIAGLPIHQLLGSYRDRIPAYASSPRLGSAEEYAEEAAGIQSAGWAAYKIHPPAVDIEEDIEICQCGSGSGRRRISAHAGLDLGIRLPAGAQSRQGNPGPRLLLVRRSSSRGRHLQLRKASLKSRYPHNGDRAFSGRLHGLRSVADVPGDRLSAGRRGGERRHHAGDEDRPFGGSLPHELRDPPRGQLAEQHSEPARHHGDEEHRVL